ncbi:MAG: hypothetical protein LBR53_07485 [Deltaproteobacteria bacterium]|jgi:urease accessory protein|nr:hypothetical protein [Deltaproteobacteria bacterium]
MEKTFFKLLYLTGASRPLGSFSFSGGLEAFISRGFARDRESLSAHLKLLLEKVWAGTEIPLFRRCFLAALKADSLELLRWNEVSSALRESHEFYLEEREPGRALMSLLREQVALPAWMEELSPQLGFLAALGAGAVLFGAKRRDLSRLSGLLMWSALENRVTAAAKLVPLGRGDSQGLLLELMPVIPGLSRRAERVGDEEIGLSLPLRGILSALHETDSLRMFRS